MATVAIIDDNSSIREIISIIVEEENHSPIPYSNAEEAIIQLNSVKPSLIFVDLFLNSMSGFEFIKKVHKLYPKLPIIALTGGYNPFEPNDCIRMALKFGAIEGISKPFDAKDIIEVIDRYTSSL